MSEKQNIGEISEIIERLDRLNLGQVSQLIEEIKEKYNIEETAIVQTSEVQSSEKAEEKASNVSLKLVDIGTQKIPIYNVIKDLVEGVNNIIEAKKLAEKGLILENVSREKAEEAKKLLEEKGAKVEIK
jgi:large subunit ribosomal protein L7/L12